MGSTSHRRNRLNRALEELSLDVPLVLGVVALSYVLAYLQFGPLVRGVVGLPILLFLPGYALLLALYPGTRREERSPALEFGSTDWGSGIGVLERFALSFGMSVALLPVVGLVLLASGLGIGLLAVLTSLSAIILLGITVGEVRRLRLHPSERFHVPLRDWYSEVVDSFNRPSGVDSMLNVALAVVIIFAVASVGYTFLAPSAGESYSSISLLTQDESGAFVASGYPSTLSTGEQTELFVTISNYEGEQTTYTLVAELQRLDSGGEETVVERQRLGQRSEAIADGETLRTRHSFAPQVTGENLRLTYFLYKGEAPTEPSVDTAYRSAYVWVTVTDESTSDASVASASATTETN